jgi:hypothetical protein
MKQTLGEARQLLAGTVDFSDEDWAVLSGQAAKELQGDLGCAEAPNTATNFISSPPKSKCLPLD